jgi:hypothetical protein
MALGILCVCYVNWLHLVEILKIILKEPTVHIYGKFYVHKFRKDRKIINERNRTRHRILT